MAKRHYLDQRRLPAHVRHPGPENRAEALVERARGGVQGNLALAEKAQKAPPTQQQSQSQLALINSSRSSGLSASGAAGQWPGPDPTGLPIPNMAKVDPNKPPLWSLGASGVSIFGGIITSEEYNPDFYWRKGIEIFEQMVRNDGQIIAIRQMLELPLRRATWSITPGSPSARDAEIASMVETNLFHDMRYETATGRILCQTWDDILRQALGHLFFGFFPFELNYRIDDGWVKWSRWTPLLPRTVWRWWVGPDAELAGIQQWTWRDYNYVYVDIPADKMLLFVNRQEGNNYEGFSLLRPAYKHWWYKTNFEKIEAIGIERNAVVPPVIYLPPSHTSNDVKAAQTIGANMRANEQMFVTLPSGWDLMYPKNEQKYAANTQVSIQYHDVMIARAVLCQFINLGSTETGAYALADSQTKTFLQALQAVGKYVEDAINYEIQRLVDYNYDDVEVYPRLTCSKLAAADIDDVATALGKLVAGPTPLINPDPDLEDYLRDQIGIPAANRSTVQATNPTAPTDPARPENARSGDHTDAESGDTKTPRESVTPGSGQDGAGSPSGEGMAASESGAGVSSVVEESRLLREALSAAMGLDAVERGLVFFNPNHDARGRFAPGDGGAKAGVAGKAKAGSGAKATKIVEAPATKAKKAKVPVSDEAFRAATIEAQRIYVDSTGFAPIANVRDEVMKTTGISKAEFQTRLNGLREAGETHKGDVLLHYEPSEHNPRNFTGDPSKYTHTYLGYPFDFMELSLRAGPIIAATGERGVGSYARPDYGYRNTNGGTRSIETLPKKGGKG